MGVMGWIAAVILVALMLPLLAWMYLDVLVQKQEVKQQTQQIERLRRKIERKENDKKPISINDNLVFDRVRRPLSLSLPRPKELE
jgi:membrane-anchored glycerophosphoryl diester phosphodiesterase (GDPDase)